MLQKRHDVKKINDEKLIKPLLTPLVKIKQEFDIITQNDLMTLNGGFESVKYNVAFFSNKFLILMNLPGLKKNTDSQKIDLFETSKYKKN